MSRTIKITIEREDVKKVLPKKTRPINIKAILESAKKVKEATENENKTYAGLGFA
mgnify:CR=1 FL=1